MIIEYWCDSERSLGGGDTNWTLSKEYNRQMRRRIVRQKKSIRRKNRKKVSEANIFTMLGWGGQCQEWSSFFWGMVMRAKRLGYRDGWE